MLTNQSNRAPAPPEAERLVFPMYLRREFFVAAIFAVAGCSGTSSTLTPSLGASSEHVAHSSNPSTYPTDRPLLFISNGNYTTVSIYQVKDLPSNPSPIASLQLDQGCPVGLAGDYAGTIYVVSSCAAYGVAEFPKGSTVQKTLITNGINHPLGVAVDSKRTLYVSSEFPAAITEYPYGHQKPSKTINGPGLLQPFGMAFDKNDNLFIADFAAGQVFELPAGGSSVSALNLQDLVAPDGVAIDDKTGDLWVTDGSGARVNIYPPGQKTPSHTITSISYPYAIGLENNGKPNGTVAIADLGAGSINVPVFKPNQYTPYVTLTNGFTQPSGLLITKP